MSTLRHFTIISRLVLAWFVLSLGVAVASPIVKPQDILLVCSGSGTMKVLVLADDGSATELASASMDCPLCAPGGAPPVSRMAAPEHVQALAYAARGMHAAHIAARTAAPPPGRGPPII